MRTATLVFALALTTSPARGEVVISVRNPTETDWKEAPVVITYGPGTAALGPGALAARSDVHTVPVQRDDLDGDGRTDELAFLASMPAGKAATYTLIQRPEGLPVPQRAAARFSLKGFDGPAWESDVTGYRIYWNADNAMDIFNKSRPILSLEYWARPGVPHNIESEYGLDTLKVGRSLGLGGFGAWIDGSIHKVSNVMKACTIRADGPIRAVVDLEYVNWQPGPIPDLAREAITSAKAPHYNLDVRVSIFAGQRWGDAVVTVTPLGESPMPELVTGLPNHDGTELIRDARAGILGRWGRQALGDRDAPNTADLGIGVILEPDAVIEMGDTDFDTYVRLRPRDGRVRYRYHGSWGKEPGGARSAREYEHMLRNVAELRPVIEVGSPGS